MDKTALVTGASGGIGEATARLLARQGYQVALAARNSERLEQIVREIQAAGGQALAVACDLGLAPDRARLIETVQAAFGPVDILVNNAGSGWYGFTVDMPEDVALGMLRLNIEGTCSLTLKLLPGMVKRGQGRIINISSIVGVMATPGSALYASTKAWNESFSRSLYRELRGSGVTLSVVRPGPVASGFFAASLKAEGGNPIPGEKTAISPDKVAALIARLVEHPRRAVWIPWRMRFLLVVDPLLGWLIDALGPRTVFVAKARKSI